MKNIESTSKIQLSQDMIEKRDAYKKIATLERTIMIKIEKQQERFLMDGKEIDKRELAHKNYIKAYQKIKNIAEKIVEKYPQEIFAREKLVKALYIIGEKEDAEKQIDELLQIEQNDEMGLWYLSEIQRDKRDLDGERQTLEKILENSKPEMKIKAAQRLSVVQKQIEQKNKKKEMREALQIKYATEEEREKFIAQVQKDFIFGKIGKKEIKEKLEEAKKYINFDKSLVALSDIEAKITDDKKGKIKMLEKYINDKNSITPEEYETIQNEIAKTRIEIEQDELIESYIDEKNKKEAQKKKQDAEEQRKYSKEIIAKMKKGNITKEELPEIIRKLETFMDSTKSIFLITKLYEALYNRDRAYKELIKYTNISSLTPGEKRKIVEMQKTLTDLHKETKTMERIKGVYKKKEEKKQKYEKKIQTKEIKKLLIEGKTVKEIFNIMKDKDSGIAIKTINRIKGHYLKRNEKLAQEQLIIKEDALALLKGGYTPDEVYEIIEYDIPISTLKIMDREWKRADIQL